MHRPLTHQEGPQSEAQAHFSGAPSPHPILVWRPFESWNRWGLFKAFLPLRPSFPSYCWQFNVTLTGCHSWKRKPSPTPPLIVMCSHQNYRVKMSTQSCLVPGTWLKSSVSVSYCSSPRRILPGSGGGWAELSAPPISVHFLGKDVYGCSV